MILGTSLVVSAVITAIVLLIIVLALSSIHKIGETQVGLVSKRFGLKKLKDDNPIAFNGEPGYQAELLMPGLRFKFILFYKVDKFPWVQVPAGEIGVIISQIGNNPPIGAKSANYNPAFKSFTDLQAFIKNGGEKGVQRPVLPGGSMAPIHPIGFLVITKRKVYGRPISTDLLKKARETGGVLTFSAWDLNEEQLNVTIIGDREMDVKDPKTGDTLRRRMVDAVGIVTAFEGQPLPPNDIACRLGGFEDVKKMEEDTTDNDANIIDVLLGSKNNLHNNYQDFQKFLDNGGKIGLQYDPLLRGAYNLNPFLIRVEQVPMLVVEQGEVAVVKSYVGLPTQDMSGAAFKYGSLVIPGHRGIWREPLRTGKYPINPHCYEAQIVPTYILTLNWADMESTAHKLDKDLKQIVAKSCEGFVFKIDLQVQIHVPDAKAPNVISMVGTMQNLVNEVLQAAVGNHFRDKLQSMKAITFIENRQKVQVEALEHIREKINEYFIETRGVYIQDVILPAELVKVLTEREIANQEIETFKKQKQAQDQRVETEHSRGLADMQQKLSQSKVEIEINGNQAEAMKLKGSGEASYLTQVGNAKGVEPRAVGLANAEAYEKQVAALGQLPTALVNVAKVLAENKIKIMPDILVAGGGNAIDALAAAFTGHIAGSKKEDKKTQ